jgi:peptide/nickel transport system substrate-binding protein
MTRLMAVLATTTVALLAVGCSSGSPTSSTSGTSAHATIPVLRVGIPETISNLDVTNSNGSFNNEVTSLSLEQVMQLGPDGRPRPWLAERVTQTSPVTYVYYLRHGVTFWDGSELTAADVAFSWNYERRPQAATASFFSSVKNITAAGKYIVVVTLAHPDASWQYTLANSASEVFEEKFYLAHKNTYGEPGTLVMGSGPWKIDSFDPTSGAELSANPHWWGGKVRIQHISFKFFSSETSEALAFRAGELDLAPQVENAHSFATTSGARLVSVPSCQTGFFSMNTQVAPWNDIHVRRAVAYVLNRADIIPATGFPATPSTTLIAPSELKTLGSQAQVASALSSLTSYPYSLAKARTEMAESAYPKGFATTLVTFNYGGFINVNEVIAAELQKIGIRAQIKNIGQNAWFAVATGPDAKRPTLYTTTGDCTPDPSTYDVFLGSNNLQPGQFNVADYAPGAVDKLIASGLATNNPAKRLVIYTKLLQQLATDVPYVPLYVQDVTYASNKFAWPSFDGAWQDRVWALELRLR